MQKDSAKQENNTKNENPELSPPRGTGAIIPLSEGTFTVDKTKLFVPFNEQAIRKFTYRGTAFCNNC